MSSAARLSRHCGLLSVLILAFALRAWQINESLWLDELHTAWVVDGRFDEIAERARIGNQTPCYFTLVWVAVGILGNHELGLRFLSLAAGLTLVAATYWVTRRWTGNSLAGLCAAALVAVDRNFIFYSQEARPYALLQLVALGQIDLLQRLRHSRRCRLRALYVLATVTLIYLHITAALLVVAESVWLLLCAARARPRQAYGVRHFTVDMGWVAVALLPLAPGVLQIAGNRESWAMFIRGQTWAGMAEWFSLGTYVGLPLGGLLLIELFALGQSWRSRPPAASQADVLTGVRAAGGAEGTAFGEPPPGEDSAGWLRTTSDSTHSSPGTGWELRSLVICWLAVPLALAWVASVTGWARLFFPRYLLASALAPIVGSALCVSAIRARCWQRLLMVVLLTSAVFGSGTIERVWRDGRILNDRQQGWRAAVRYVNSRLESGGRPVFVRSGFIEANRLRFDSSELLRRYCLAPVNSLYRIDAQHRQVIPLPTSHAGRLNEQAVAELRRAHGGWFVVNGSRRGHVAFERELAQTMRRHGLADCRCTGKTFGEILLIELSWDGEVRRPSRHNRNDP